MSPVRTNPGALRLPARRRAANRLLHAAAVTLGGALVLVGLVLARRSPLSAAVLAVVGVSLLVLASVPMRLPSSPTLSVDPARPGVLLPGSRAHPGLVTALVGILLVFVLLTVLPAVALVGDPSLEAGVLAAVGVIACVLVGLNLRALGRPGRSLLVGPHGLSLPELGDELVAWEQVGEVDVTSAYRRRPVPRHVPVVTLLLHLPSRGKALYSLDQVELGPEPRRTFDALGRLARGSADRSLLGTPESLCLFESAPS